MPNKITVAPHAGFCFGVERATGAVEKRMREHRTGERIFTLGHLIHNTGYNGWLQENGVRMIEEEEILPLCESATEASPVMLYIRAHGVTRQTYELLESCKSRNEFFDFEDMTCPFVKKIHRIAQENCNDESFFALLGSADHPEVVGIMSHAKGESAVFESAESLREFLKNDPLSKMHKKTLILAAQTTQNLAEW